MPDPSSSSTAVPTADARIVHAGFAMVGEAAVGRLTLRPLARRAGVSVATVLHHFPGRDGVLLGLAGQAIAAERAFHQRWLALASQTPRPDAAARRLLADLAFQDWIMCNRLAIMLLVDLLHARARAAACPAAIDVWVAEAEDFWSTMMFGVACHGRAALGFVLDEAVYAFGAWPNMRYRALRAACFERFITHLSPHGPPGSNCLVDALVRGLQPPASAPLPPGKAQQRKAQQIADAAADRLLADGVDGVTHRAVAVAAGVPPATVVYHFGSRDTLISAGLYAVIARFHAQRASPQAGQPAHSDMLVQATSLIALASARQPALVPHAIDMRRRRGENISMETLAASGFPVAADDDRLTAQAIAIAFFGMRLIAMATGDDADTGAALRAVAAGNRAPMSP